MRRLHRRDRVLAAEEDAPQVRRVDRSPGVQRRMLRVVRSHVRNKARDAGIVHENVDTPVHRRGLGKHTTGYLLPGCETGAGDE